MTDTEQAFIRAVRRGDERQVEELRDLLLMLGHTREQIRDLWEIFGVSVEDKVAGWEQADRRRPITGMGGT